MQTIEQQTGWKRTFSQMICQDVDVLKSVSKYSFDLSNTGFRNYFKSRTGVAVSQNDVFLISMSIEDAEKWVMLSKDFKTILGETIPLSERCSHWNCFKVKFGQMQDCWELFVDKIK